MRQQKKIKFDKQTKKNEDKAHKNVLDFRKQWNAIQHILHLYWTQFIKHFHIVAFHIEAPNCLAAILNIAQHTQLQKKFLWRESWKSCLKGKNKILESRPLSFSSKLMEMCKQ